MSARNDPRMVRSFVLRILACFLPLLLLEAGMVSWGPANSLLTGSLFLLLAGHAMAWWMCDWTLTHLIPGKELLRGLWCPGWPTLLALALPLVVLDLSLRVDLPELLGKAVLYLIGSRNGVSIAFHLLVSAVILSPCAAFLVRRFRANPVSVALGGPVLAVLLALRYGSPWCLPETGVYIPLLWLVLTGLVAGCHALCILALLCQRGALATFRDHVWTPRPANLLATVFLRAYGPAVLVLPLLPAALDESIFEKYHREAERDYRRRKTFTFYTAEDLRQERERCDKWREDAKKHPPEWRGHARAALLFLVPATWFLSDVLLTGRREGREMLRLGPLFGCVLAHPIACLVPLAGVAAVGAGTLYSLPEGVVMDHVPQGLLDRTLLAGALYLAVYTVVLAGSGAVSTFHEHVWPQVLQASLYQPPAPPVERDRAASPSEEARTDQLRKQAAETDAEIALVEKQIEEDRVHKRNPHLLERELAALRRRRAEIETQINQPTTP